MERQYLRAKKYSKSPGGMQKIKIGHKKYMDLVRHIGSVLREVMGEEEILSLEEISNRIHKSRNVRMKPSTIEGLLSKYIEKYGESPLEAIDGDTYKLNLKFYEKLSKRI